VGAVGAVEAVEAVGAVGAAGAGGSGGAGEVPERPTGIEFIFRRLSDIVPSKAAYVVLMLTPVQSDTYFDPEYLEDFRLEEYNIRAIIFSKRNDTVVLLSQNSLCIITPATDESAQIEILPKDNAEDGNISFIKEKLRRYIDFSSPTVIKFILYESKLLIMKTEETRQKVSEESESRLKTPRLPSLIKTSSRIPAPKLQRSGEEKKFKESFNKLREYFSPYLNNLDFFKELFTNISDRLEGLGEMLEIERYDNIDRYDTYRLLMIIKFIVKCKDVINQYLDEAKQYFNVIKSSNIAIPLFFQNEAAKHLKSMNALIKSSLNVIDNISNVTDIRIYTKEYSTNVTKLLDDALVFADFFIKTLPSAKLDVNNYDCLIGTIYLIVLLIIIWEKISIFTKKSGHEEVTDILPRIVESFNKVIYVKSYFRSFSDDTNIDVKLNEEKESIKQRIEDLTKAQESAIENIRIPLDNIHFSEILRLSRESISIYRNFISIQDNKRKEVIAKIVSDERITSYESPELDVLRVILTFIKEIDQDTRNAMLGPKYMQIAKYEPIRHIIAEIKMAPGSDVLTSIEYIDERIFSDESSEEIKTIDEYLKFMKKLGIRQSSGLIKVYDMLRVLASVSASPPTSPSASPPTSPYASQISSHTYSQGLNDEGIAAIEDILSYKHSFVSISTDPIHLLNEKLLHDLSGKIEKWGILANVSKDLIASMSYIKETDQCIINTINNLNNEELESLYNLIKKLGSSLAEEDIKYLINLSILSRYNRITELLNKIREHLTSTK
jgi:hypothetical protein